MTTTVRPRVALTIDAEHPDRPAAPEGSRRLIEILADLGVVATFFIQGRWAEAHPDLARRIVADGHLVGSHSFYHARMPLLSTPGLRTDIAAAEEAIREQAGVDPRPWFRCPFGAGSRDRRVLTEVARAGYRHIGWNVSPEDWEPGRTPAEVEEAIMAGVIDHGDGAVVLMHSWPNPNLPALPRIVERLLREGWTFVRLDALDLVPTLPGWATPATGQETHFRPSATAPARP